MVCLTARICMACMGQCHRNPLSEPKGSILNAATLDDRLLHVVVLDRYTGPRMLHCRITSSRPRIYCNPYCNRAGTHWYTMDKPAPPIHRNSHKQAENRTH